MFVVLWCVSLKKNLSSIFWASLRAGVFSQKSTIAFKTRKITMGEHASAFFVVVVEFAVVRRPSSLHPHPSPSATGPRSFFFLI